MVWAVIMKVRGLLLYRLCNPRETCSKLLFALFRIRGKRYWWVSVRVFVAQRFKRFISPRQRFPLPLPATCSKGDASVSHSTARTTCTSWCFPAGTRPKSLGPTLLSSLSTSKAYSAASTACTIHVRDVLVLYTTNPLGCLFVCCCASFELRNSAAFTVFAQKIWGVSK